MGIFSSIRVWTLTITLLIYWIVLCVNYGKNVTYGCIVTPQLHIPTCRYNHTLSINLYPRQRGMLFSDLYIREWSEMTCFVQWTGPNLIAVAITEKLCCIYAGRTYNTSSVHSEAEHNIVDVEHGSMVSLIMMMLCTPQTFLFIQPVCSVHAVYIGGAWLSISRVEARLY